MLKTGKTRVYCNVKRLNSELNQSKYTHACFKWKQSESLVRRIWRLLDPPLFFFLFKWTKEMGDPSPNWNRNGTQKCFTQNSTLSLSLSLSTYSGLPKPFIYNTFSQSLKFLFLSLSLWKKHNPRSPFSLSHSLTHSLSLSLSLCIYTSTNKHIYKLVL